MVVLISGSGSNLQAIIDAIDSHQIPASIAAVISNKPEAYGLERASKAGIATVSIDHTAFSSRESFDAELQRIIDSYQPDLIVLAGFMRILSNGFVAHFRKRMVNIHPSLLPAYTGLNTHQRAIAAGEAEHGVSIHFVTDELDGGPVIAQARVPILPDDTAEQLASRVLQQEHQLYPNTLKLIAEGRISTDNKDIYLDNKKCDVPLDLTEHLIT